MLTVIVSFCCGVAATIGVILLAARAEDARREREILGGPQLRPWDPRKTSIFDGRPLERRP